MGTNPGQEAAVSRILERLRTDGVPFSSRAILTAVEDPLWDAAGALHDWRSYIPPAVREEWSELPLTSRLCLFETTELLALAEQLPTTFVTGPT